MDKKTGFTGTRRITLPSSGISIDSSWIVIERDSNPTIKFDTRVLDSVLATDCVLWLSVGEMLLKLVLDDAKSTHMIVEELSGHTRFARIRTQHQYEKAQEFLELLDKPLTPLLIADDPVQVKHDHVVVAGLEYTFEQVQRLACRGDNLALVGGWVQAAFVVLAIEVAGIDNYLEHLIGRISEYERSHGEQD